MTGTKFWESDWGGGQKWRLWYEGKKEANGFGRAEKVGEEVNGKDQDERETDRKLFKNAIVKPNYFILIK